MNVSRRDMILTGVILFLVLVVGSILFGNYIKGSWEYKERLLTQLVSTNRVNARLVAEREKVLADLEGVRARLPRYRMKQQVSSDLVQSIKRIAAQYGVSLTRTDPKPEKTVGDLYEVIIECQWESPLEGITRFLYGVQTEDAILDIRQITIAPAQTAAGQLKGNFTVHCAYSRVEDEGNAPAPAAGAPSTPAAAKPGG